MRSCGRLFNNVFSRRQCTANNQLAVMAHSSRKTDSANRNTQTCSSDIQGVFCSNAALHLEHNPCVCDLEPRSGHKSDRTQGSPSIVQNRLYLTDRQPRASQLAYGRRYRCLGLWTLILKSGLLHIGNSETSSGFSLTCFLR